MQIIIGTEDGRTYSKDIDETGQNFLEGKRIGEEFDASVLGLDGYTLEIRGGSDKQGFPMKKNLHGTSRRKILAKEGTGVRNLRRGERKRKSMRGNAVSEEIVQVNTKVVEKGSEDIESLLNPEEEEEDEN